MSKKLHISLIFSNLERYPGMIGAATGFLVELLYVVQLQTVNYTADYADRIILRYILIDSLWKKNQLVGSVRNKVYLCHSYKLYV